MTGWLSFASHILITFNIYRVKSVLFVRTLRDSIPECGAIFPPPLWHSLPCPHALTSGSASPFPFCAGGLGISSSTNPPLSPDPDPPLLPPAGLLDMWYTTRLCTSGHSRKKRHTRFHTFRAVSAADSGAALPVMADTRKQASSMKEVTSERTITAVEEQTTVRVRRIHRRTMGDENSTRRNSRRPECLLSTI